LGDYNPLENKVMKNTTESAKPKSGRGYQMTWREYNDMSEMWASKMSPQEAEKFKREREQSWEEMMSWTRF
jgi:hypothetical protein